MRIQDNTVVITGGGSGIGLALAEALLGAGNTVVICGRDEAKLRHVQQRWPQLHTVVCDITQPSQVATLKAFLTERFPRFNVLINNAGVQRHPDFTSPDSIEDFAAEIEVNLAAQIRMTQRLLPLLLRQPQAALVNVTSALALAPKKSAPVYCAAKAGLRAFTRALRYQLEGSPVRVLEVIPDLVDTAMTRDRPHKGKTSPQEVARQVMRGLRRDRQEIRVGKTRLLFAVHRLWPALAYGLLKNG